MSDVVPLKPKQKVWLNIYRDLVGSCGSAHTTRALADQWGGKGRIACIEVEYETGEGLNATEQGNRTG